MRDNGAIQGAASGFAKDDSVITLSKFDNSKVYVIGHTEGLKLCGWRFRVYQDNGRIVTPYNCDNYFNIVVYKSSEDGSGAGYCQELWYYNGHYYVYGYLEGEYYGYEVPKESAYNEENKIWMLESPTSDQVDANGYFVTFYTRDYSFTTQHPYKYRYDDWFNAADLIPVGEYLKERVPYWRTDYSNHYSPVQHGEVPPYYTGQYPERFTFCWAGQNEAITETIGVYSSIDYFTYPQVRAPIGGWSEIFTLTPPPVVYPPWDAYDSSSIDETLTVSGALSVTKENPVWPWEVKETHGCSATFIAATIPDPTPENPNAEPTPVTVTGTTHTMSLAFAYTATITVYYRRWISDPGYYEYTSITDPVDAIMGDFSAAIAVQPDV